MDENKIIKHSSFGNLSISRSFGGKRHLYGSSIEHSNFITLRISHSELHRHLKQDWYHATAPIVEVTLSQAQFAEAITSLNMGDGVPVTINYTEKDGRAEPTPFESKYDTFKEEFSYHIDEINKETKNIRNEIAHGIMTEESGRSGTSIYLICALIKLLVISSPTCLNMLADNKKLKSKVNIDDEPVKIIDEDIEGISEESTERAD